MGTVQKYDDSSIRQMSQLEHIRSKYEMYIGAGNLDADYQLTKELIDNAADEALNKNKIYNIKIILFTDGTRYQFAIIDSGRGVPCGKLRSVYTEGFVSGKYDKAYNAISCGSFGIGSKTNTALSKVFVAITKRMDGFAGLKVESGLVKDYQVLSAIDNDATTVGTSVIYETDPTILKESNKFISDVNGCGRMIKLLEYISVFKPNVRFTVYKVNKLLPVKWFNNTYTEQWQYLQKVSGEVLYQTPEHLDAFEYSKVQFDITDKTVWKFSGTKELNTEEESDEVGFNIEIGLTDNPEKHNGVLGCVNYNVINTWKASHLGTLQDQFKERLATYIDEDDSDLRAYFKTQYIIPFHGYVSAFARNASFINQTKDSFYNSTWAKLYAQQLHLLLIKEDDQLFEKLFELVQEDLVKKFNQSMNRVLNTGKSLKNVAFELKRSNSYFACETKDKSLAILNIVEGLSSGNWITQLRDPAFQAVYELRGKCLNTFTSSSEQWRKDDVFSDLVRLIGVHPRDTNLDNMNFKEICIMADADPDGLAIIDLLIGMFYNINPLILDQGRVTIAMPPLYVLSSKDKTMFLRDQHALDDAKVVIYETHLKVGVSVNGGQIQYMHGDTYRDAIYLIKHICTIIESVSRKLAIDPFIVEQMCHCTQYIHPGHVNTEAIKYILGLSDCLYDSSSNVITLIQDRAEVSIPIDRLLNEIKIYIMPELEKIHWQALCFFVTTKDTNYYKDAPVMFWQLQQIFDTFDKEFKISRIKGLGEYTADQLRYTCLDPATRTVVTIRGLGDVKTLFDMLGVDTSERKKLVVSDLDSEWTRGVL